MLREYTTSADRKQHEMWLPFQTEAEQLGGYQPRGAGGGGSGALFRLENRKVHGD